MSRRSHPINTVPYLITMNHTAGILIGHIRGSFPQVLTKAQEDPLYINYVAIERSVSRSVGKQKAERRRKNGIEEEKRKKINNSEGTVLNTYGIKRSVPTVKKYEIGREGIVINII